MRKILNFVLGSIMLFAGIVAAIPVLSDLGVSLGTGQQLGTVALACIPISGVLIWFGVKVQDRYYESEDASDGGIGKKQQAPLS